MIIFLDFDDTLFNASLLKTDSVYETKDGTVSCEDLSDNLAQFLFLDTIPFLERFKEDYLVLLSYSRAGTTGYGNELIQRTKIERCGITSYCKEVIITGGQAKGGIIKEVISRVGGECPVIFLDDRISWLSEAKEINSEVIPVLMRRGTGGYDNQDNEEDFYEVKNLDEFTDLIIKTF